MYVAERRHNMAKRLHDASKLSQEDWLYKRKESIGGSEIGAIAGVSKWASPLSVYVSKTRDGVEIIDNENMKWGRKLETTIAEDFAELSPELIGHQVKIQRQNFVYAHDDYPFLTASLDRRIIDPINGTGVLEVKTSNAFNNEEWEDDGVPDSYYCQVMWYMGIMGYKYAYIYCLFGGQHAELRRVDFDQEAFDGLVQIGVTFWNEFVLKKIMPAPMGIKAEDEVIASLTGPSEDVTEIDETEITHQIVLQRIYNNEAMKESTLLKKQAESQLKLMMGSTAVLLTKEYKVSYKTNKRGIRSMTFTKRKVT